MILGIIPGDWKLANIYLIFILVKSNSSQILIERKQKQEHFVNVEVTFFVTIRPLKKIIFLYKMQK